MISSASGRCLLCRALTLAVLTLVSILVASVWAGSLYASNNRVTHSHVGPQRTSTTTAANRLINAVHLYDRPVSVSRSDSAEASLSRATEDDENPIERIYQPNPKHGSEPYIDSQGRVVSKAPTPGTERVRGCPGSRRTLSGGPPALSAPVGSVRGD
jgi:hypothetical protein